MLQERGADQRFDDVAQNGAFLGTAGLRLAVPEQDERADVQLVPGDRRQGLLRNGLGAHLRQLAFGHVGMQREQRLGRYQFQHGVAEEFQPLIVRCAGVFVRERTMGERLYQQIRADGDAQRGEQLFARFRFSHVFLLVHRIRPHAHALNAYAQCPDGNMRQYTKTLPPVDGRVFISLSAFGCDHLV